MKTIEIPAYLLDTAMMTIERAIKIAEYVPILVEEFNAVSELGGIHKQQREELQIQLKERESIASNCEELKKYHMEESAKRYKALLKEERRTKVWKMGTVAASGFALGYVLLDRLGLIQ